MQALNTLPPRAAAAAAWHCKHRWHLSAFMLLSVGVPPLTIRPCHCMTYCMAWHPAGHNNAT